MPTALPPQLTEPAYRGRDRVAARALLLISLLITGHLYVPAVQAMPATARDRTDVADMDLQLIADMQRQGAWQASLANIEAYRYTYGDSGAVDLLRAEALRSLGQPVQAQPIYQRLLTTTQAAAAWHGLGMIHGDPQALARACALEPDNPVYLADLGEARLHHGAFAQAEIPLRKAAQLAPRDPVIITRLAIWQWLAGKHAAAEAQLEQAGIAAPARAAIYRQAESLQARWPPQAATAAPVDGSIRSRPKAAEPPAQAMFPARMLDRFAGHASDPSPHPSLAIPSSQGRPALQLRQGTIPVGDAPS